MIQKDALIRKERKIGFRDVIAKIENNEFLALKTHPNTDKYPNQKIYFVELDGYVYAVPCVIEDTKIFLKTISQSRKANKLLKGSKK